MVNTITDNRVATATAQQSQGNDEKRQTGGSESAGARTGSSDDRVEVSRRGRLFSDAATQTRPSSGAIENPAQAESLVARIRQQFEQAGSAALQAQTAGEGGALSGLLEAAPA